MSQITEVFKGGHKVLITYITAGYPDISTTNEIAVLLAENGADIIELGIPFSDPLADGATIQRASYQALHSGTTPEACLEIAERTRRKIKTPLVFMTYYNPILNYGQEAFCQDCRKVGINGLIIPDLPPEEGNELEAIAHRFDLDIIYMLAPTSTETRIIEVGKRSRGFIYLVSLTGVTGTRNELSTGLEEFVGKVRQKTKKPLCIGFGISSAAQAKSVADLADGVIVGSRIIELIEQDATLSSLRTFVASLRRSLDSG